MNKKIPTHAFKTQQSTTLPVAIFWGDSDKEVETKARLWLIQNRAVDWSSEYLITGFERATPVPRRKKSQPLRYKMEVMITPPSDADPDHVARVRKAIAALAREQHA